MPQTRHRARISLNDDVLVHKLPDELLAEVFRISLEAVQGSPGADARSLLTVTSVCAIWRRVALGMPTLWKKLVIGPPIASKRCTARLQAYLSRSRGCLLDVNITLSEDEGPTKRLVKLLRPHMRRIQSLNIASHTYDSRDSVFPLDWALDSLEILTLHITRIGPPAASHEVFMPGCSFPLRQVTLRSAIHCRLNHLPTSQLESMNVLTSNAPFFDIMMLVSRSPRLEDLHLPRVMASGYPHMEYVDLPYSLPQLRALRIHDQLSLTFPLVLNAANITFLSITNDPWAFFTRATTSSPTVWPCLTHLEIRGRVEDTSLRLPGDLRAILKANPSITRISFAKCSGVADAVIALLYEFPLDSAQLMTSSQYDDANFRKPEDPSTMIVPALESLDLRECTNQDDHRLAPMLDALLARRPRLIVRCDTQSAAGCHLFWRDDVPARFLVEA